jgi:pyrimidine operon attenuation protein/uracil phosphoribosyltransferase
MKEIMNQEQISRTLKRMTHEIIERHHDLNNLVLVGVKQKGVPVARRLAENLFRFADIEVPVVALDITAYRDDLENKVESQSKKIFDLTNKRVIIVDDVLFTGRSVRASMDAINDMGRPSTIELAILIDRGHRELPIRADYIGKNIPTSYSEKVIVEWDKRVYITSF